MITSPQDSRDKFDPRALKCIFIRYSPQKGYKCYHPPTRKVYVTMDVTFREHEAYYQPTLTDVSQNKNKEMNESILTDTGSD